MHPAIAKAKQAAAMTSLAETHAEILPRLDRIESALALLAGPPGDPILPAAPASPGLPASGGVLEAVKALRADVDRLLSGVAELLGTSPAPATAGPEVPEAPDGPPAAAEPPPDAGRAQEPATRPQGGRNRR